MELVASQKQMLLDIARNAIEKKLGLSGDEREYADPLFFQQAATFVTLQKEGRLRGCIGNLVPISSLVASIEKNAVNAAFHDSRFSPVKPDELEKIDLSISILTKPCPLHFQYGEDLVVRLQPHRDGVVLKKGRLSATFLPQVWEQLPEPADFLDHLCHKAGIQKDLWRTGDVEVSVYQVTGFSEKDFPK